MKENINKLPQKVTLVKDFYPFTKGVELMLNDSGQFYNCNLICPFYNDNGNQVEEVSIIVKVFASPLLISQQICVASEDYLEVKRKEEEEERNDKIEQIKSLLAEL